MAATIRFRQQAYGQGYGYTTTPTLRAAYSVTRLITTPRAGSLILVAVTWRQLTGEAPPTKTVVSVKDSQGNLYLPAGAQTDSTNIYQVGYLSCQLWYAYNIVAGPQHDVTVTFSMGQIYNYAEVTEWTGVETAVDPLDGASGAWSSANPCAPGAIVPSVDGALAFACFMSKPRSNLPPTPTGFTALRRPTDTSPYYVIQSTAASVNPSMDYFPTVSRMAVFRPAAVDEGTPDLPIEIVDTPPAPRVGVMPTNDRGVFYAHSAEVFSTPFTLMCWCKNYADILIDFGSDFIFAQFGGNAYLDAEMNGVTCRQDHGFYANETAWWHTALVYDGTTLTLYFTYEDLQTFDLSVPYRLTGTFPSPLSGTVDLYFDGNTDPLWSSAWNAAASSCG